jgi:hypothetical protein
MPQLPDLLIDVYILRKKKAVVRLRATALSLVVSSIEELIDYNLGPALTNSLPAALPSYLAKFLMKRPAKSLALTSHSEAAL